MSTIRGTVGDLPKVSAKVSHQETVGGNIGKKIINIGKDGTTFTPDVSEDGVISWTNNGELPNPAPVNIKGTPGYTPRKGVDYNDGASVSISKITESDASGGKNEVVFSNGSSLTVKNGKDGTTPEKGKDYFNEADKAEMVEAVLSALPVYDGEVVSE